MTSVVPNGPGRRGATQGQAEPVGPATATASPEPTVAGGATGATAPIGAPMDLARRREELAARFAELQWDLGGLVYEMAIRDNIRLDVLVRRAASLQEVDSELGEVERILRLEETGTAGQCASCGAPHSSGAVYCWQCGQPLLEHVASHSIGT